MARKAIYGLAGSGNSGSYADPPRTELELRSFLVASLLAFAAACSLPAYGQETSDDTEVSDEADALQEQEHRSGFSTPPVFGGPNSPAAQIEFDDRKKEAVIKRLDDFMQPWFDWKSGLEEKHGFAFSGHYATLFTSVSDSVTGEDTAFSGSFRFIGSWILTGESGSDTGGLVTMIDHRHAFTDAAPGAFGCQTGYLGICGVLFSDQDWVVVSLNWQQSFGDRRHFFLAGRYDQSEYENVIWLSPWTSFQNINVLLEPSTPLTDSSWGIGGGSWLNDQWYLLGGIKDANGTITDDLEFFEGGAEFYSFGEIGWSPSQDERYFKNVNLVLWHVDARPDAGQPESSKGMAVATSWTWDMKWMAFARAGWSDGDAPLYNRSATIGVLRQLEVRTDVLGLGVNWGDPADNSLSNQTTVEAFWRFQLTPQIALTPSVQYLKNPVGNPNEDTVWLWGLRFRFTY